ncbi:TPA: ISAs1 family transposase [Klebsiella oxytoca]|uniref:ISAs1 family transposase n=1 Tax=Klebsiella oxytoca TaxID=571 RepID=A0AAN5L650_KLEOX|nr:ISAs1 family transposase [Klebsiella oxytoca]
MSQASSILSIVTLHDPRRLWKVRHSLVDTLVVAVCGTLAGADNFQEIELWAEHQIEWLRSFLPLKNGIPSHDTFGRLFGLICPEQFESAFRRRVAEVLPALSPQVVALDGKTSSRSGSHSQSP